MVSFLLQFEMLSGIICSYNKINNFSNENLLESLFRRLPNMFCLLNMEKLQPHSNLHQHTIAISSQISNRQTTSETSIKEWNVNIDFFNFINNGSRKTIKIILFLCIFFLVSQFLKFFPYIFFCIHVLTFINFEN